MCPRSLAGSVTYRPAHLNRWCLGATAVTASTQHTVCTVPTLRSTRVISALNTGVSALCRMAEWHLGLWDMHMLLPMGAVQNHP